MIRQDNDNDKTVMIRQDKDNDKTVNDKTRQWQWQDSKW